MIGIKSHFDWTVSLKTLIPKFKIIINSYKTKNKKQKMYNNNFSATAIFVLLLSSQVLTMTALIGAPSQRTPIAYAPDMGIIEVAQWNRDLMNGLKKAKDGLTAPIPLSKPGTKMHQTRDPKLQNLTEAYTAIQNSMKAFNANFEGVYLGEGLTKFKKFLADNQYRLFKTNKGMMTDTLNLLSHGILSMSEIKTTGLGIPTGIKGGLRLVDGLLLK